MQENDDADEPTPGDPGSCQPPREDISDVVLRYTPALGRNCRGEPVIEIPLEDVPGIEKRFEPINSERVRGELSVIIQKEMHRTLNRHETGRLVQLLTGYANRQPQSLPSREELFAAETWIEALEIFLRSPECGGQFSGTVTKLLTALTQVRESEGLSSTKSKWPASVSVLGAKLSAFEGLLYGIGVELNRDRDSCKRTVVLTLMTRNDGDVTPIRPTSSFVENRAITGNDAGDSIPMDVFTRLKKKRESE